MQENIVPFHVERDVSAVFALWQETIGHEWPIEAVGFEQVLAGRGSQHFVAYQGGQVVGFIATGISDRNEGRTGHMAVLLVAPFMQRQGIGSALHRAAMEHLRKSGARQVQLGGGSPRFFPGVPDNLPFALPFFSAQGWNFDDQPYRMAYDLAQNLESYTTPARIMRRMTNERISFGVATREDISEVLAFEEREFAGWLAAFERVARFGDYSDVLVGRDERGRVVATLLMYTPQSHSDGLDVLWQLLLGKRLGAMSCVGVARAERMRGIGITLVARATELLIERGVDTCYIDWVTFTEFYGRLGYKVWRGYSMCWRKM